MRSTASRTLQACRFGQDNASNSVSPLSEQRQDVSAELTHQPCHSSPTEVTEARLSSNGQYAVTLTKNANIAQVHRLETQPQPSSLIRVCAPWHPTRIRKAYWLNGGEAGLNQATLVTETVDGYLRLWKCFPDEPHYFVLWLTVGPGTNDLTPVAYFWLAEIGQNKLLAVLEDGSLRLHTIEVSTTVLQPAAWIQS